jgi:twitching motility protein PilT
MEGKNIFNKLLHECVDKGASDMHLTSDESAVFRINGRLHVQQENVISRETLESMLDSIMTEHQRKEFGVSYTVDLGYSTENGNRFRINCYRETGRPAMAVRYLDQRMLSFEQLCLPPELRDLAYLKSGLVLVTGVTGSGKSTTLAVLLDEINRNRDCHIMTVEDPVEFVHKSRKSLVHHREVYTDVPDYANAVRAFLREDPDVIMVGEMRDLETMNAAIIAAETGHLVFSTLHTGEAVGAVERFIGYFPGSEQEVARHRIALTLKAVVAQQLLPALNGQGRIPVVELLKITTAVSSMIENSKTRQIYSVMEGGAADGMWTLDQALAKLVRKKLVSRKEALHICNQSRTLKSLLGIPATQGR